MIRMQPEPGYRWYVRDADSGAVLGWFDYQVASWFAADQRQVGRDVEIGRARRSGDRAQVADALWRFLCQCYADRTRDHVPQFIEENARDVLEATCYMIVAGSRLSS
jgi:hypothetical protein